MHSIHLQLPDPLYAEIVQAAAASGQSVEAVVVKQLAVDFADELPESFFTPELLTSIDQAFVEAEQTGFLTLEQAREERLAKSRAWRAKQPA